MTKEEMKEFNNGLALTREEHRRYHKMIKETIRTKRDIIIMRVTFYFIIGLLVIAGALYLTTNFWEVI